MSDKRNIFPLAALNQSLERFMRENFAHKSFWVIAEITKVQEKNGHHYLELADSKDGKRIAEMAANMWFSAFNKVNRELKGELPKIFKAGNKVLLQVRIEFHTIYGLKLNVLDVDPSVTFGEIEKKKKETIARLKKEGLFELQHALYLPPVIKKIALIGSPNTSGYRDFLSELKQNRVFTNFTVKEFAASVQGDRAVKEIITALAEANQYDVDAIVLVRGGGSKMDLNVFNDYIIAQAVCESRVPVITGIGHENDEVVVDLVARKSEITPTAVAKFLYVSVGAFKSELRESFDAVLKMALGLVSAQQNEFNHTSKYLVHFTQRLLQEHNTMIRNSVHRLHIGTTEMVEAEKARLQLLLSRAGNYARNAIALRKSTELNAQLDKIGLMSQNAIDKSRIEVSNLADLLNLLNPEALLKKGYTISTIGEVELKNKDQVEVGDEMKTLSNQYLITSKVVEVKASQLSDE